MARVILLSTIFVFLFSSAFAAVTAKKVNNIGVAGLVEYFQKYPSSYQQNFIDAFESRVVLDSGDSGVCVYSQEKDAHYVLSSYRNGYQDGYVLQNVDGIPTPFHFKIKMRQENPGVASGMTYARQLSGQTLTEIKFNKNTPNCKAQISPLFVITNEPVLIIDTGSTSGDPVLDNQGNSLGVKPGEKNLLGSFATGYANNFKISVNTTLAGVEFNADDEYSGTSAIDGGSGGMVLNRFGHVIGIVTEFYNGQYIENPQDEVDSDYLLGVNAGLFSMAINWSIAIPETIDDEFDFNFVPSDFITYFTYEQDTDWRERYSNTIEGAVFNKANYAPGADNDKDGISNEMEYILGGAMNHKESILRFLNMQYNSKTDLYDFAYSIRSNIDPSIKIKLQELDKDTDKWKDVVYDNDFKTNVGLINYFSREDKNGMFRFYVENLPSQRKGRIN